MSHIVEKTTHLTDADADYIADYTARANYGRDGHFLILTGVSYKDNRALHKLCARAYLQRGSVCGFILVTADRNGAIIIIPPNVPSRILDFDWRSGRDKAWDEFVIQAGGREAIEKRLANIDRVFKEHLTKIYGPDKGIECFRSTKFAVHPDFQGRGIGRAIHEKMCSIAKEEKAPYFFTTARNTIPIYERLGCKKIGEPVQTMDQEIGHDYDKGIAFAQVFEGYRPEDANRSSA